jgi:hypothetical protein
MTANDPLSPPDSSEWVPAAPAVSQGAPQKTVEPPTTPPSEAAPEQRLAPMPAIRVQSLADLDELPTRDVDKHRALMGTALAESRWQTIRSSGRLANWRRTAGPCSNSSSRRHVSQRAWHSSLRRVTLEAPTLR